MRLLLAFWLLAVLVFMASFGGHLRSTLLLEQQNDHIRNLDDVLRFPDVQPLLESGSSAEALFRSGSHPTYKAIWERMSGKIGSRMSLDDLLSEETLDKVEQGSHIVITEISSLVGGLAKRYENKKTCSYYTSDTFFPKHMVIIMRKNLNITIQREVKKRVGRFYPIGVVKHRVMDRTSNSRKCLYTDKTTTRVTVMTVTDFQGVFYLWMSGVLLSFLSFGMEMLVYRNSTISD